MNEACVHIFSAMGLYEEALDLALEVRPSLGASPYASNHSDEALPIRGFILLGVVSLQIKVELAKKIADQPSQNKDLQKALWLKIAKHVIEKQKDIDQ